jgi:hypothetical protein
VCVARATARRCCEMRSRRAVDRFPDIGQYTGIASDESFSGSSSAFKSFSGFPSTIEEERTQQLTLLREAVAFQ